MTATAAVSGISSASLLVAAADDDDAAFATAQTHTHNSEYVHKTTYSEAVGSKASPRTSTCPCRICLTFAEAVRRVFDACLQS